MMSMEWTPAATVRIICPSHPEQVLAVLAIGPTGDHTWIEDEAHMSCQWIGPGPAWRNVTLGDGTPARVAIGAPATAPPAAGDEAHIRYVFRCPRPSCGLDEQRVATTLTAAIKRALRTMRDLGVPDARVTVKDIVAHR